MQINSNDFKANEIIKFIRQYTNLTQYEFAKKIGKSHAWVQSNELGRTNYLFKDLMEICNIFNIEIKITSKKELK